MPRRRLIPLLLWYLGLGLGLAALPLACGPDSVKSPFGPGAGGGSADGAAGMQGDAGFRLAIDAGDEVDPTLGGPCQDDGQCDDQVDCTDNGCDQTLGRCRFTPNDARCADASYCNGEEKCDVRAGCGPGEPVACSDNDTCTIDVCIEATQSCRHDARDADGDGDPTRDCGGKDCDDQNPLVSSSALEICGNQLDDDCDAQVDEPDCSAPEHDTCAQALEITAAGFYDIDLSATQLDYPTTCATEVAGFRDAVVTLVVPDAGPLDVDVIAKLDQGQVSLGTADSCGDAASARCEASFQSPLGAGVSRLLLRGLLPGKYPIYVAADSETIAQLRVDFRAPEPKLGELCEDAQSLLPSAEPVLVRLPGYAADASSGCVTQAPPDSTTQTSTGDAFLSFTLDAASDVTLIAEAQDDLGLPVLSLLSASCKHELTCRVSQPGRLFVRDLAAGSYRVAVSGTAPDDVSVRLETSPVSEAPPGEGCASPPTLDVGVEQLIDLSTHEDAVDPGCLTGAPDVSYGFALDAKKDVALVGRFSSGDRGGVSIAQEDCRASYACRVDSGTVRALSYGLDAGQYRAIIQSEQGNPVGLSLFERPAALAVHVPFADNCDGLLAVPETGGRFSGNTANAFPDFSAGCDVGGQAEGGAPDQILKLSLSAARRVILDMQGSAYNTLLSVRAGEFCPGIELPLACAPGYWSSRSYLDLDLQKGAYFIQIDGYDGDAGAWKLDVFTAPL
jgi:hypothetical protein